MIPSLAKMNPPPEQERFARNAAVMTDVLREAVNKAAAAGHTVISPMMLEMAISVIKGFDHHHLIQGFIQGCHDTNGGKLQSPTECWDNIKARKESFFLENAGIIFHYLPSNQVNLFRDLFELKDSQGRPVVGQALKEQLWDLFDAMVKISIKYVHKGRQPYSYVNQEGKKSNAYGKSFFDNVDIRHHATVWGVTDLAFPAAV